MGVAVEDRVRPVGADRGRKPTGTEKRPDPLWLADHRRLHGCVVEEHDAALAACDRLEPCLETVDLRRGLGVDLAQQPFPEVRDLRTGEPSDEPFRADDAELLASGVDDRVLAIEYDYAGILERGAHGIGEAAVMVVVSQDREHGNGHPAARVGEHLRLLRSAVSRQITGEEHDIRRAPDRVERGGEPVAMLLGRMDVTDRGDAELGHLHAIPASWDSDASPPGTNPAMPSPPGEDFEELIATMKRTAAALRDAGVPVLLGGGLAAWARGGPPTDHDVDYYVRERDAERALAALVTIGLRPERPPEGWLLKAWDDDVLVDLIYRPAGGAIDDGHFRRATRLEVSALALDVAAVDDILVTKVLALTEQEPDFRAVLELARSLREQVDWAAVRRRVAGYPFGTAFLTLVAELQIAPSPHHEGDEPVQLDALSRPAPGRRSGLAPVRVADRGT
jgi:hypothetical protein